MLDLMVDLETTGTAPDDNAIIQIAAVRFNYTTGEVGRSFCASLTIPPGRFWDEGTRSWWMKQSDVYHEIMSTAQPADQVWKAFADWCLETSPALSLDQRLWAKPVSFEWPFLQSYARQFGQDLCFHYRNAVDLNSFCRGLAGDPGAAPLDPKIEFVGTKHNALDDCLHQIRVALSAKYLIARAAQ